MRDLVTRPPVQLVAWKSADVVLPFQLVAWKSEDVAAFALLQCNPSASSADPHGAAALHVAPSNGNQLGASTSLTNYPPSRFLRFVPLKGLCFHKTASPDFLKQSSFSSPSALLSFLCFLFVYNPLESELINLKKEMMDEAVGLEGSVEWAEQEGTFNSWLDKVLASDGIESPRMVEEENRPRDRPKEPDSNSKRQKIGPCTDKTEEPSPLGLILRITPSFLDLIDRKLSQKKTTPLNGPTSGTSIEKQQTRNDEYNIQPTLMKWKASNFPATKLKIGCWERKSRNEGDIVAKFYYARRKLVWEIQEERLKKKIEIQWTDISATRARFIRDQPDILEVELRQQPMFFKEVNPQPRKHTNWEACSDFTSGNATTNRRHYLEFAEGTLEKHYERLLRSDHRLLTLSQKVFASHDSQFFETVNSDMQDMCMLQPKFPPISNQPSSNWCPPHLNHIDNQGSAPTHMWTFESHDPAVGANHPLSLLTPTPRVIQMNSPSSVMECLPTMNQGASSLNPMTSYLADNLALNNGNSATDSTLNRMTQLCNQDIQSLRRVDDISV
ncbi:uncharacterized protein LOC120108517 isoform X1 [Phoenix dactylifera]|uniref:Uncharacterized protein LOC120108517 isoform X1 n=2 Tax=Phoenix dactylifera TaxID=42345 RepID=A0A8B8ZUV4_PHODC|nr:uncharacterized protein LOC120108517 isoform X1 [Phoenix dactylifera]